MKEKNKIILFLSQYRKLIATKVLLRNTLLMIIVLSSISMLFILLEEFTYFDTHYRIRIVVLIASIFICLCIYILTVFIFQKTGKIKSFSNEVLSKKIGQENNEVSDKLTNAYQLSKIKTKNTISNDFINYAILQVNNQINNLEYPKILNIFYTKTTWGALFISVSLLGLLFNSQFNSAAKRLINPTTPYEVPVPFNIINYTSNEMLLEGDSLKIKFDIINGLAPDSIEIIINKPNQNLVIKTPYLNNSYEYNMKNILAPFTYWAQYQSTSMLNPWNIIASNKNSVEIIKRPRISTINFTVIPPKYSKLDKKKYASNNTDISMLEGSTLKINASANKNIKKSWAIINDEKINLSVENHLMAGSLNITTSSDITLMCEDEKGIENINPPLNKITALPDYKPQIFISEPTNEFDINEDRLINIDMQIIDDFGFSELWIEYRLIRPEYLSQDSSIYKYKISNLVLDLKAQKIQLEWNVADLSLAPDDKIEFYVLVADNNNITGPSIASSGPFIGKVPSLEDLFNTINNMENEVFESAEEIVLTIDEVKDLVDDLEKDLLKSDEINWEQSEKINESSKKIDDIINEIEAIKEILQDVQQESEENELFNQDLMQKFDEFQELLDSIMTPEMMETLKKIKEMMSQMSTDQMLNTVQDLKQDISMLDEQLDRFIELFEMVMSEQAFDEIIKILEELINEQMNISNRLLDKNTIIDELEVLEKNQINSFDKLLSIIIDNIPVISKFSSSAGSQLEKLVNSELILKTNLDLENTRLAIKEKKINDSLNGSELIISDFDEILEIIEKIKNEFNSESVNKMTSEFITLLKNVDSISFDQELIINKSKGIRSNSPKLREIAFEQNIIQNKIIKIIAQLMELSNKTFHIPPTINKSIGSAQLSIQKAIGSIEQKKIHTGRIEQKKALNLINETAYLLLQSLENMQNSMSASGMESYLEQLEKMAGEQQQVNQGTGQCMMPGGGMPGQMNMQEALMKRLQAQQEALQEQLGEMMSEMSGGQNSGGLSKALEDMEEVIDDFKRRKITRETMDRQEKILSRMLDSQKSLKQKDYSEKRKSNTGSTFNFEGPMSLPDDFGERQTMLTNALQDALEHGYSTDYQIVLKKYFKNLEENE